MQPLAWSSGGGLKPRVESPFLLPLQLRLQFRGMLRAVAVLRCRDYPHQRPIFSLKTARHKQVLVVKTLFTAFGTTLDQWLNSQIPLTYLDQEGKSHADRNSTLESTPGHFWGINWCLSLLHNGDARLRASRLADAVRGYLFRGRLKVNRMRLIHIVQEGNSR
jgi:hypothetical protein